MNEQEAIKAIQDDVLPLDRIWIDYLVAKSESLDVIIRYNKLLLRFENKIVFENPDEIIRQIMEVYIKNIAK